LRRDTLLTSYSRPRPTFTRVPKDNTEQINADRRRARAIG